MKYNAEYMFSMTIPKIAIASTYNYYREGDNHNHCRIGVKQDGAFVADLFLDDGSTNLNSSCTIEVFTR